MDDRLLRGTARRDYRNDDSGGCAQWLKQEKQLAIGQRLSSEEFAALEKRAPQQARLYEFIEQQFRPQKKSLVLSRLDLTAAVSNALVKRGVLLETTQRIERVAYVDDHSRGELVAAQPPALNAEQSAAVAAVTARLATGKFGVSLLHGVTGSGNSEVYLHAIDTVLKAGGGVAFLVPEVALTPQTVARLRSRLEAIAPGNKCVVWHSHLSEGERLDGWLALATGEARVVVGARSAVFAPVQNLRLIVVDEEHEPAYKQDETPRYHGRDVAVMRAKLCGAVCLLGSATPSLESFHNAQAGRYQLLELKQRVDDRKLPHIDVVDMKIEVMKQRGLTTLSRKLVDAMHARLERREQTILFINRRGYSSSMLCTKCGHTEECPHCSITMTYHRSDETLRCHLCNSQRAAPTRCPACGAPEIRWRGLGTQRVEEAVRRVLPRARVVASSVSSDCAGEVVVQTFTPQAEAIQFSRHADFAGFAAAELKLRKDFNYPPYRHLIHHLFRGPNPEKLKFFAEQWAKLVEKTFGARVELRGPSPCPIEKIKDEYRWQIWYFVAGVTQVIGELSKLRSEFAWPDDLTQVIDVDPVSLM